MGAILLIKTRSKLSTVQPGWPDELPLAPSDLVGRIWGLWGSVGRNELSVNSDIDLLTWSPDSSTVVSGSVEAWDYHRPIDLLRIGRDPYLHGLSSGIDLYAISSVNSLMGDASLIAKFRSAQKSLDENEAIRARELLHLILGQASKNRIQSPEGIDYKLMPGGTRAWSMLHIAHGFSPGGTFHIPVDESLRQTAEIVGIDPNVILNARTLAMNIRNGTERNSGRHEDLGNDCLELAALWQKVAQLYLLANLDWIQSVAGAPAELLKCALEQLLDWPCSVPPPKLVDNSVVQFLTAMIASDEAELAAMAGAGSDWWTISAITMNPNTTASTLQRLAFPDWEYDKSGWRHPRMQIVHHPRTPISTLAKLASTDNQFLGTFPSGAKLVLASRQSVVGD